MIRAQAEEEEQMMMCLGDDLHVVGQWEFAGKEG